MTEQFRLDIFMTGGNGIVTCLKNRQLLFNEDTLELLGSNKNEESIKLHRTEFIDQKVTKPGFKVIVIHLRKRVNDSVRSLKLHFNSNNESFIPMVVNKFNEFIERNACLPSTSVIKYKSDPKTVCVQESAEVLLITSHKDGLNCTWTAYIDFSSLKDGNCLFMKWEFDWDRLLERDEIEYFEGYISVSFVRTPEKPITYYVELTHSKGHAIERFVKEANYHRMYFTFEYCLTGFRAKKIYSFDSLFLKSKETDVTLLVGGKEIHANKAFLSFHSDYFQAMFNADYKEREMHEISIEEVGYEELALLLAVIYPHPVFPSDDTAELLLKMAGRFLMPAVTKHVEKHLCTNSHISISRLIWIADEYNLDNLHAKILDSITCTQQIKKIKESKYFSHLTTSTKLTLLDKMCDFS